MTVLFEQVFYQRYSQSLVLSELLAVTIYSSTYKYFTIKHGEGTAQRVRPDTLFPL